MGAVISTQIKNFNFMLHFCVLKSMSEHVSSVHGLLLVCCISEQVTNGTFSCFRWWRRLGRLWWWQDGRRWPRTGQGRSTGTLLNHPSPPSHNIHTSHKNQALSLFTKPRCYEKKIETYSNYLNLFTLNLLCTPAECLYHLYTFWPRS